MLNIWCWTFPKKAFRLNKHIHAPWQSVNSVLYRTPLPYGERAREGDHLEAQLEWKQSASKERGAAVACGPSGADGQRFVCRLFAESCLWW